MTDVWSFRYIDWIFVSERPIEIICLWHDHTCYMGFTLPLFLPLVINSMHGMVKHTNTSYHYIYILYIDYFRIVLRRNNYDIFYKKNELIFSLFYKTQPRIRKSPNKSLNNHGWENLSSKSMDSLATIDRDTTVSNVHNFCIIVRNVSSDNYSPNFDPSRCPWNSNWFLCSDKMTWWKTLLEILYLSMLLLF